MAKRKPAVQLAPIQMMLDGAPELADNTIFHVGVSGGKDSAAALIWLVNESGIPREKIRASYSDIDNDHEWTKQHVKLLSETVHPIEFIYPEVVEGGWNRDGGDDRRRCPVVAHRLARQRVMGRRAKKSRAPRDSANKSPRVLRGA